MSDLGVPTATPAEPEIENVTSSFFSSLWRDHLLLGIAAIVAPIALLVVLCSLERFDPTTGTYTISFQLIAVPLVIPIIAFSYLYQKLQHEMMQQIATSLGFAYAKTGRPDGLTKFILFSIGHSQRLNDVMSGTYRTLPARIFTYQYTVGSGRDSHTYYKTTLQLSYGASLPHFVLHPKKFFGSGMELSFFSGLEEVDLEGNFGKYFSLRIEKGAQIEAREIFEPDVMQYLIDHYSKLSLEAWGATLAITHDGVYHDRTQFLALISLADQLIDKLLPGIASAASTAPAA